MERATGREIHGVVENAMGRSTEEALAASRERIEGLWGEDGLSSDEGLQGGEGDVAGSAGASPVERTGRPDAAAEASGEVRDTLERARRALDTAPAEDQAEMIDLIQDLHEALHEGRTDDADAVRQNLDEILFYLE